jgi:hypothetical protein
MDINEIINTRARIVKNSFGCHRSNVKKHIAITLTYHYSLGISALSKRDFFEEAKRELVNMRCRREIMAAAELERMAARARYERYFERYGRRAPHGH